MSDFLLPVAAANGKQTPKQQGSKPAGQSTPTPGESGRCSTLTPSQLKCSIGLSVDLVTSLIYCHMGAKGLQVESKRKLLQPQSPRLRAIVKRKQVS